MGFPRAWCFLNPGKPKSPAASQPGVGGEALVKIPQGQGNSRRRSFSPLPHTAPFSLVELCSCTFRRKLWGRLCPAQDAQKGEGIGDREEAQGTGRRQERQEARGIAGGDVPRANTFSVCTVLLAGPWLSHQRKTLESEIPQEAQTHVVHGCLAKWEDVPCLTPVLWRPMGPFWVISLIISAKSWT